ncbi:hypothetical protein C882_3681 [Caenispirillum salinarum AK4]|uniref:Uncharacterized protein n=1 Tax=Caenispirillum salinarum AK4 TaxID=1238182 RepID=K9HLT6_9PROT|nr:hypothetical protein C882_3681 [Caenispirillum salinarum AK4]
MDASPFRDGRKRWPAPAGGRVASVERITPPTARDFESLPEPPNTCNEGIIFAIRSYGPYLGQQN